MNKFSHKQLPYPHWEYLNYETTDRLRIVPERGGLVTEWRCKGKEILYFDQQRFMDKDKSIRGGIPILFPISGDLPGDLLQLPQGNYRLKQHGFARDSIWKISMLEDELGVRLNLSDSEATLNIYPFLFNLSIEVRMKESTLDFNINIHNRSDILMPFSFGLHPYFNISDLNQIDLEGLHSKCINQLNMQESKVQDQIKKLDQGVDFLSEYNGIVKIIDCSSGDCIRLDQQEPLDLTVVWTNPPRPMICVEPWTSPRGSLNNGERRLELQSDSSLSLQTSITYEKLTEYH